MADPLPIMADPFKNNGKSIMNYGRSCRSTINHGRSIK